MSVQAKIKKIGKSKVLLVVSGVIVITIITSMLIGIFTNSNSQSEVSSSGSTDNYISEPSRPGESGGGNKPAPTMAPASGGTVAYASAPVAQDAARTANQTNTGYNPVTGNNDPSRMIIRNATIALESQDVEKTLADIRAIVVAQQGTVFSSNTTLRNDKTYATMVLQVPSQGYDATMAQLRKAGHKVQSETSTSQDVTEEFADAEAQLRNLKATEAQFLELLKKANSVNDTITVQNQLTSVRGQIERLQGRLNYLQKKSDFSTITVNIAPFNAPTTAKPDTNTWDFSKVLENAWAGSMKGLQGLVTMLVNVGVYMVWVLPLFGILFIIGMVWWRRTFPRKPKNNESMPAPAE
jgi:uncharacterized protein YdcH (DUF465 family)